MYKTDKKIAKTVGQKGKWTQLTPKIIKNGYLNSYIYT
jgi:hypothetical protein